MSLQSGRLTDSDRRTIAQARALSAAAGATAIREHLTGRGLMNDLEACDPYPYAFGVARSLLGTLADIAERVADVTT
jgi:hypothetical protein